MYKCHLCKLETKQLNGLLTKHWKNHCSASYTKDQYKVDLLSHNGRKQPICPKCNLPTQIPKGESEYPLRHKKCYVEELSTNIGSQNINYRGGMSTVQCAQCHADITKHPSHLKRDHKFCSTSCAMNFYALPENRTEAQINSDAAGKEFFKQIKNTDKFKVAHATALAKMQEEKKSKIEQKFLEAVQEIHPDAIGSYVLDFYTFDVFIPSTMELFEVNGNYWHNMPDTRARDIRKTRFIKSNRPEYKLYSVWENELNDIESKHMLAHARQDVGVLILSGPSGCGKSYVGDLLKDRFNIIDYDTLGYDGCIAAARLNIGVKNIIITSFQGKRMSTELRLAGIRNHCVYLREESSVIKDRIMSRGSCLDSLDKRVARYESLKDKIFQYYGTQQDIIEWFISL